MPVPENGAGKGARMKNVTPEKIFQLGTGFWGSKTLLSAVELGVFTELGPGPLDAQALASRLGVHPRAARDFFDALVALGMLARDNGKYSNTEETARFLDRASPDYVGGILEMCNARLYGFWGALTEALKTGKPQNEAKSGVNLFEALAADPERLRLFMAAMTGVSRPAAKAMAAKFPWADYKTVIDIGCAEGAVPVELALAHRHLTCGGFDTPAVKPVFEDYVGKHYLEHRVKFHAGSFFTGPLPMADVLIMGHILHDWDLAEKRMLLRKAYEALPEGGALIVYDAIIDDERKQNAFGLLMSLNMLIETPGGFDYTGADCIGWMREAGFHGARVEHLLGPDSMVIGFK
jgi:hypothetical protein